MSIADSGAGTATLTDAPARAAAGRRAQAGARTRTGAPAQAGPAGNDLPKVASGTSTQPGTPAGPAMAARASDRLALRLALRTGDALALIVALAAAYVLRFGEQEAALAVGPTSVPYVVCAFALALAWWVTLAIGGTRDERIAGLATTETRAIGDWTLRLFGTLAILAFATKVDVARSFFVYSLFLGLALLLAERQLVRAWLTRERAAGRQIKRVLAVGDDAAISQFATRIAGEPRTGYRLAGRLEPLAADDGPVLSHDISRVLTRARSLEVDAVAFVASGLIDPESRRRIDWALREEGIDVVVVPPLDATAGARLVTEYVGGLPLIHLFSGSPTVKQFAKAVFDKVVAVIAVALFALPALVIAAAIKLTSAGPVLYAQERVGMNGRRFTMLKFRTMRVGAHTEREALAGQDDGNGMLFKLKDDPRVTRVGRVLRRYSLDEVPQFLNVLAGSMSVVGPRPPLPEEVARYDDTELRRLLVKPGITGLWQVGGRSDLSWEDSVRLDLHYVDTWSVVKDSAICLRTVRAMLVGEGAY